MPCAGIINERHRAAALKDILETDDVEDVIHALRQHPELFDSVPEKWKDDEDVCIAATGLYNPGGRMEFERLPATFRRDPEALVWFFNEMKRRLDSSSWNSEDCCLLRACSEACRNDENVVLASVSLYGGSLGYASNTMKSNWDIAKAAVLNDGRAIMDIAEDLRGNRELVLAAFQYDRWWGWRAESGTVFYYCDKRLLNDVCFVRDVLAVASTHRDSADPQKMSFYKTWRCDGFEDTDGPYSYTTTFSLAARRAISEDRFARLAWYCKKKDVPLPVLKRIVSFDHGGLGKAMVAVVKTYDSRKAKKRKRGE